MSEGRGTKGAFAGHGSRALGSRNRDSRPAGGAFDGRCAGCMGGGKSAESMAAARARREDFAGFGGVGRGMESAKWSRASSRFRGPRGGFGVVGGEILPRGQGPATSGKRRRRAQERRGLLLAA